MVFRDDARVPVRWQIDFPIDSEIPPDYPKANIPDDILATKRAALAAEHNLPGAREQLTKGFKDWLETDFFKENCASTVPVPQSTPQEIADV